jgi:hypothetical protein
MQTRNVIRQANATEIVPELGLLPVGSSLYIPNERGKGFPPIGAVRVQVYGLEARKRFRCEYDDDGLRVWRLE